MGCAIPRNSIAVQPCTDEGFTLLLVLGVVRGLYRVFLIVFFTGENLVIFLYFSSIFTSLSPVKHTSPPKKKSGGVQVFGGVPREEFEVGNPMLMSEIRENELQRGKEKKKIQVVTGGLIPLLSNSCLEP